MKTIILGFLGSVGTSLKEVLPKFIDKLDIKLISLDLNKEQNIKYLDDNPISTTYYCPNELEFFKNRYPSLNFISGEDNLHNYIKKFKGLVINLLPSIIGYRALLYSIKKNNIIITSHKEAFVIDGDNIMRLIKKNKVRIIPVDSEIYALRYLINTNKNIAKYIITASGGALRDISPDTLITKELVLNHPTWQMAPEITVCSATLVNKIYELVEAHHYFGIDYKDLLVLINRESSVHSAIITNDQKIILNTSVNKMSHPIELALNEVFKINNTTRYNYLPKALNFSEVNEAKYPLYKLGLSIISNKDKLLVYFLSNLYFVNLFLNDNIDFNQLQLSVSDSVVNFNYQILTSNLSLEDKITLINQEISRRK